MSAKYDIIGSNYAELRRPDPRIARIIEQALGSAQTVVNAGAGTGGYEPADRSVTAVEPSREMIRQRRPGAAPAIAASASDLPFEDKKFDAAMAILTIHHWPDKAAGLRELRRVTRGQMVLLTFDPSHRPWLTDYLPELAALDEAQAPKMTDYERWLGPVRITPVLVPHDCSSTPIGAGLRPILIHESAPAVPPSGPSAMQKRDCKTCGGILKPARGSAVMPNCSALMNMMPDTGSSYRTDSFHSGSHSHLAPAPYPWRRTKDGGWPDYPRLCSQNVLDKEIGI